MKNTGKPSQKQFEDLIQKKFGKQAFVWRMTDSAEVRGMNKGKASNVKSQPSDYIVTASGDMFYAEVKSTVGKRISRSCLEATQYTSAVKQTAAKGRYWVFVHFISTGAWYKIPASLFINSPPTVKSWAEAELSFYLFS